MLLGHCRQNCQRPAGRYFTGTNRIECHSFAASAEGAYQGDEQKQVRYLFADEVGLGKTIEAGLVMRELKLRGLVKRILVCAPKGLVSQWVSEMQTHFNESFQLMLPGEQNHRMNMTISGRVMIKLSVLSTVSSPLKAAKGGHSNNLMSTTSFVLMTCLLRVGTLSSLMKPIGSAVAPTSRPIQAGPRFGRSCSLFIVIIRYTTSRQK